MKAILFVLFMICTIGTCYAYRAPDSCLKMWRVATNPDWPNPDSVRVDSCEGSPTFTMEYVKRNFFIHTYTKLLNFSNSTQSNDTTFITWQNVKQQHQVVRNILQSMEEKFSTYKMFIVDTAYFSNHLGYNLTFEFDNYAPIRNVIRHLDSMQKDTLAKFGNAFYFDIRFLSTAINEEQLDEANEKEKIMISIGKHTLRIMPVSDIVHCAMYSSMGDEIKISYSEIERQIILPRELATGIYFIKINTHIYTYLHQY